MKKLLLVGICCFCAVTSYAALSTIEVDIAQTSGSTAVYTYDSGAGTGSIAWSGGGSGFALGGSNYLSFDQVSVSASFTGMTDLSTGGDAKATFDAGVFAMTLTNTTFGGSITINGELRPTSLYTEKEVDNPSHNGQSLDGRGVVKITSYDFSFLGLQWSSPVVWGNSQNLAGLQASILFDPLYRQITDYQTNYESDAVTITLLADDQAIPEPATLAILGLGALLLGRRRA